MKKILFLAISGLLILGACGNKEADNKEKEENNKKETDTKGKDDKKVNSKNNNKTKYSNKGNNSTSKSNYNNEAVTNNIEETNDTQNLETMNDKLYNEQQEQNATNAPQENIPEDSYNPNDTIPETSKGYGLNYNYPQENKNDNPSGYLSEEEAQRMADLASQYDEEVAKHNAKVLDDKNSD
ncbi:hypothetical protein [Staphylococcus auricularis]|uniref:hypothetical protein n=1 Tax=Staphylococcus auricularis TaxID=29379 RepID=UPI001931E60C|nr:hypothetical protein [Staphylococcus auricularis]MBM0867004.1 hypothetical protein [Staphylococcus auricularis]